MKAHIVVRSPMPSSFRAAKVMGMFDVPAQDEQVLEFDAELPIEGLDWHIGAIVGPSGSGKSTLARHLFPDAYVRGFEWGAPCLLDDFPKELTPQQIVEALASVGLSSAPIWLRPYGVLSTGQQFRADLARALGQETMVVYDEFTSVVNRHVAKAASVAVSKYVRRTAKRFVAVTCHDDVLPWLEPDWVFDTETWQFRSGEHLQRPHIRVECYPGSLEAWRLFRGHHYMSASLSRNARAYLAYADLDGQEVLAGFFSVLPAFGMAGWVRGHRIVVLPDLQGLGIGNRMVEACAEQLWQRERKRYREVSSAIGFIAYRRKHPEAWRLSQAPHMATPVGKTSSTGGRYKTSAGRLSASWEYIPQELRRHREEAQPAAQSQRS